MRVSNHDAFWPAIQGFVPRLFVLCLGAPVFALPGCTDRDYPVGILPEPSPLFAIGVDGSQVNLTNDPDVQTLANVSGDFVVWVDRRNGLPAEIWGCDVTTSLDSCSASAVRLATDAYDSASEGLGISGSVLVWSTAPLGLTTTTPRELRGCDLGGSLSADECVGESNYTVLANQAAFPEVSGDVVIWLDLGATVLSGCNISGGLAACSSAAIQLSPNDKAPSASTDPGTDGSFVAWRTGLGDGSNMFACDVRGGLSQCAATAELIASGRLAAGIHPSISNGRVVWSGLWSGSDIDIVGCDLSSGLSACGVVSLTEGLGLSETEPDIDGNVVVWKGGGMKACELATGAVECSAAPVELSSGGGLRPAISGNTVVWALSGEVYGVRLSLIVDSPRFDYPLGVGECSTYALSDYRVTADFLDPAYDRVGGSKHTGEDWNRKTGGDTDLGDPVCSIGDGTVTVARPFPRWSNIVVVEHTLPDGTKRWSQYAHLHEIFVEVDLHVRKGDVIGTVGRQVPGSPCITRGAKAGRNCAHLHFEIRQRDVDPNHWPNDEDLIRQEYLDPSDIDRDINPEIGFIESNQ